MKPIAWIAEFGLIAVALLHPAAAEACAVCGFGPGIEGDPTARGFYWGILFLMAMPFAVAGSIGAWLVYRYWRANAGRKATSELFAWIPNRMLRYAFSPRLIKKVQTTHPSDGSPGGAPGTHPQDGCRCETYSSVRAPQRRASAPTPQMGLFQQPAKESGQ